MNFKILICSFAATIYVAAQEPAANTFAKDGAHSDDCDIAVVVNFDKGALATVLQTKSLRINVVMKNTGKEKALIDDIPINNGVIFYAISPKGEKIAIFPTPKPYSGSGGVITLAPGKSFTVNISVPLDVIKPQFKEFVVSVKKLGNAPSKACLAFSEPFSLPAVK